MQSKLNAYKETAIKTASQGKIIIMLYDEAVRQLDISVSLLEDENTKEFDKVNNAILRAQDMITELMVSLDFEKGGEIAQGLFSLYMFFNRQMMEANMKKDVSSLKWVRGQIAELREAWIQIINKSGNGKQSAGGVNIAG
jgi:flagellar secretion chaperone FliS